MFIYLTRRRFPPPLRRQETARSVAAGLFSLELALALVRFYRATLGGGRRRSRHCRFLVTGGAGVDCGLRGKTDQGAVAALSVLSLVDPRSGRAGCHTFGTGSLSAFSDKASCLQVFRSCSSVRSFPARRRSSLAAANLAIHSAASSGIALLPSLPTWFYVSRRADRGRSGDSIVPNALTALAFVEADRPASARVQESVSKPGKSRAARAAAGAILHRW